MSYKFHAGGKEREVNEARMGQILALRRFLARIPRPAPAPLNLDGVMDALSRGATEVLPPDFAEKVDRGTIEVHLREVRRIGREVAHRLVREIREEERFWPPDPQHQYGLHLLMSVEGGPEELLLQMLRTGDPGITPAEVRTIIDDPADGILESDLHAAAAEFFGINRQLAELQAIQEAEAAGGKAEGEPDAGGDGPAPARKARRGGRSTTTASTPS